MSKDIAYQNKDILFKFLSELYHDQALSVYGFDFPNIKEMLPNEFPAVKTDAKRADSIFLLEDDSILLLEYESNQRIVENHLKYVEYVLNIINRYYKETNEIKKVHVAIVYSSDIEEAIQMLDTGSLILQTQSIFMKQHDGDAVYKEIEQKILNGETLYQEEILKFILVPLMKSGIDKMTMVKNAIELSKQISHDKVQAEVIAGLLTVSDKFIDQNYAKHVKEWLKLTKVGRLFEEDKQEAIKKAIEETKKQSIIEMAKNMLNENADITFVKKVTGLTDEEIKKLKPVH